MFGCAAFDLLFVLVDYLLLAFDQLLEEINLVSFSSQLLSSLFSVTTIFEFTADWHFLTGFEYLFDWRFDHRHDFVLLNYLFKLATFAIIDLRIAGTLSIGFAIPQTLLQRIMQTLINLRIVIIFQPQFIDPLLQLRVLPQHCFKLLLQLEDLFLHAELLAHLLLLLLEHTLQFLHFLFEFDIFLLELEVPDVLGRGELLLWSVGVVVVGVVGAYHDSFDDLVDGYISKWVH